MSLLVRYPGYYDYNRRIVTSLVREGYLKERKFRDYDNHVVRSLSLTKKGMEHIQAESPAHAEVILSHELSPASGQGDWKKTLRLHRSAACFLAAYQAGAYWVPGEEKDERSRTQLTYYGAYEFHPQQIRPAPEGRRTPAVFVPQPFPTVVFTAVSPDGEFPSLCGVDTKQPIS